MIRIIKGSTRGIVVHPVLDCRLHTSESFRSGHNAFLCAIALASMAAFFESFACGEGGKNGETAAGTGGGGLGAEGTVGGSVDMESV